MNNHATTVAYYPFSNHGYPFRATCECGWTSTSYAAQHAAQQMADEHMASVSDG